jgi:hypothetical protein
MTVAYLIFLNDLGWVNQISGKNKKKLNTG